MPVNVLKPTYVIGNLGELGVMPDGSIVNIGGTINPSFTVGGKPLMFADGTSTDPSNPTNFFTLQKAYDNSQSGVVNLTANKPFGATALNGNQLIINATTGDVSITGEVSGIAKLSIAPKQADVVAIKVLPVPGITATSNLLELWNDTTSTQPVFSVSANGNVTARLLNGVDITSFYSQFVAHTSSAQGIKHSAQQISVDSSTLVNVSGANVQQVIESIDSKLSSSGTGGVHGFEYEQISPAIIWTIQHNKNSRKVQLTIWDNDDQTILADTVTIVDSNSVRVVFNTPMTGRVVLMVF